ncbi:MAG: hypothetical protein C6I01_02035 [Epsilonproteobacteria bacterium]|jgi:rhodanese-related sulfurtransferase|nr:hypothetical protein [Campylobacterota bacterium]NPA88874.1 rhodanese-like domain-containing protein [Campylobacterota bacterium]
MKAKGLIILLLFSFTALFGFQRIPATLKTVLLLRKYGIPLVDIRPKQEIKFTGMIKWAINIPMISRYGSILYSNLHTFKRQFPLKWWRDPRRSIALITKTGLDAIPVARLLEQQGYHIIILSGGYNYLFKDMLLNMDKFLTLDIIKRL